MINKISVETDKINSINARRNKKDAAKNSLSFKGLGSLALQGMQACERMPMINVAVIDMLSAILPRTIVESMTNWFAGFEAFRRESSGLVLNCLIPSLITLGIAKGINGGFMPKGIDMSECWADSSLVDKAKDYYLQASSSDKVKESLKNILGDIQGFDRKSNIIFKDALSKEEIDKYSEKLAELSRSKESNRKIAKEVKKLSAEIVKKTHVSENVKIAAKTGEVKASSVNGMLVDSVKFFKGFQQTEGKIPIENFAQKSKNLVKAKSLMGLAVILPLAISMQYINRWITGKVSGVKGAPIYDDFAKGKENIEENPEAKKGLLKQKLISISSMIGVSMLSMMKMPSMNMLEFKGMFPTMDQARIISTATFSSRMAAADDKNELAEATIRDITTFSSMYFLGDYATKAAASIIQKKTGVELLNETKKLDKNANIFKKAWHWIKDINVKSSEEVISKTEESLKGKTPTGEQLKTIEKELKRAEGLRSACQAANIGVSLAILGLIVPILTRRNTKKKHEQALKLAGERAQTQTENQKQQESVTPLNVKYSSLTAGFRADKH